MEVNKDEADKCLKIGAEAMRRGDNARAIKFLRKSLQLFPLPGAEALLSQAVAQEKAAGNQQSSDNGGSTSPQSSNGGASASASFRREESTTGADGREYTDEQAQTVKKVLRAKEGGRGAHYRVLGLQQDCSENDIKKAYRKLSLKVHPDKNSAPHADEAFKAVGLAYATLSDTQKRAIYDRYGDEDPDNVGGGGGMRRHGSGVHMHGQEVNPEEIFNMFFGGGMGGAGMGPGFHMYNGFGGPGVHFQAGGPRRRPQQQRGQRERPEDRQAAAGLQMLFQFLPIIMIFLISFLQLTGDSRGSSMDNRYFSLTHNPPYVNPLSTRLSQVKDIPYFVTDKFLRSFYRDRYQLAQVERLVERAYEQYLVDECETQNRYKKTLQRKALNEPDEEERQRKLQAAEEFSLTRCEELGDLFPGRKNRKRKTSRW